MTLGTIGVLALLALADSTSFGTLLIPIWLLLASRRPHASRILLYLATVAVFYFVIGLLLSAGAILFLDDLREWLATDGGATALGIVGVVLLAGAVLFGSRKKRDDAAPSDSKLLRWRERAVSSEEGSPVPLMGLALTATVIEVATLLPYLMAIGIMAGADLDAPVRALLLAGYCFVMVLPALVLLGLRLVANRWVEPALTKVNDWMTKSMGEMSAWIVGIVGFLLAREALRHFGGAAEFLSHLRSLVG